MSLEIVTKFVPRTIESAPRDGTDILVWTGTIWRAVRWSGWGGGVWSCSGTGHNLMLFEPKHWLPMLPPPETA